MPRTAAPVVKPAKKRRQQRVANKNDRLQCPLCYSLVQITGDRLGFIAQCSGCIMSVHLVPKTSIPLALEEFKRFLLELEMGSDMWGSKIRDGVVED